MVWDVLSAGVRSGLLLLSIRKGQCHKGTAVFGVMD